MFDKKLRFELNIFCCELCFDVTWTFTSAVRFVSSLISRNFWYIELPKHNRSGWLVDMSWSKSSSVDNCLSGPLEVYIFFIRTALRDSDGMMS